MYDEYLNRLCAHDLLTREEEQDLFRRMKKGDDGAAERLLLCNVRLVVNLCRSYSSYGVEFLDLFEEGFIGLMIALEKFDAESGNRFITYATWGIRRALSLAVDNYGRLIRIPVYVSLREKAINRAANKLFPELGREPDVAEVAKESKLSTEIVSETKVSIRVAEAIYLEELVADNDVETTEWLETRLDGGCDPQVAAELSELEAKIQWALDTLPSREARLITLRYGLNGARPHTLKEVAKKMGVTGERARQLEKVALKKLRHPWRARKLREFMGIG